MKSRSDGPEVSDCISAKVPIVPPVCGKRIQETLSFGAIEIDNIWALQFGQDGGPNGAHNQLFFTGGPHGYANGVFGVITFGQ